MFRIFSEGQGGKFYLSPYTEVMFDRGTEKLVICQTLFNCGAVIRCVPEWGEELIGKLRTGVEENALEEYLGRLMGRETAIRTVQEWIRLGVLE